VGQAIPFEDKKTLEDLACYLTRNPLSLKKLVYLDGQSAVLYRSRLNPRLRRNFEAMDPLEWLARLSDHIPDPGKHRVHFYGAYACRSRGAHRASEELAKEGCEPEPAGKKKRCPPSWARLIHKVYQADPLVCRRCGGKIKIVGYVHDTISIRRILEHLGLSPPAEKPPPETNGVVRVPVDEEGREIATP
jgi:Putative transposase